MLRQLRRKPQDAPKRPPRGPQEAPRRPQEASRAPQETPKTPSGSILEPSWCHLGAILGHLGRSSTILLRASNMSPLGGSAEALWPKTFKTKLKITCFSTLSLRQRAHIRMAFHWAGNMSPLGRAGAPALRAESAAPCRRQGGTGVLDHLRLLQTPLLRRLRLPQPSRNPSGRTRDAILYPLN